MHFGGCFDRRLMRCLLGDLDEGFLRFDGRTILDVHRLLVDQGIQRFGPVRCTVIHGLEHRLVSIVKRCRRLKHLSLVIFRNRYQRWVFLHWHPKAERVVFIFHGPRGQPGGVDWNLMIEVAQTMRLPAHRLHGQRQRHITVPRESGKTPAKHIVAQQMRTRLAQLFGNPQQLVVNRCTPFVNVPTLQVKRFNFLHDGVSHALHHRFAVR